jgi:hypothetical protein
MSEIFSHISFFKQHCNTPPALEKKKETIFKHQAIDQHPFISDH